MPDAPGVFPEPLAAAVEILEQSHIRPTERVAVVGDGKLGLLCAQAMRLPGCEVVVIGRHPARWELLHELGIATAHAGSLDERRTTNDEAHAGHSSFVLRPSSFDVVVDCTGQPSGLATARSLVRPRGRLVLKSTFAAESGLNLSRLVVDEVQLLGSRCGPFAPALRLLDRGLIQVQPLVAGQFSLRHGLEAFT